MAVRKKTEKPIVAQKPKFIFAVGRRREAVARVRLYPEDTEGAAWGDVSLKKGDILVNKKPIGEYFSGEIARLAFTEPFRVTNVVNKFSATVRVVGGGKHGQLEAIVHGLARALAAYDKEKFRPILKKKGLLTRDARVRERRKVGMGGKARRKRQSPKR